MMLRDRLEEQRELMVLGQAAKFWTLRELRVVRPHPRRRVGRNEGVATADAIRTRSTCLLETHLPVLS